MKRESWKLFLWIPALLIFLSPVLKGRAEEGQRQGGNGNARSVQETLGDWEALYTAILKVFSARLKLLSDYRPSQSVSNIKLSDYSPQFDQGLKDFRAALQRLLAVTPPYQIENFHHRFLPIYRRMIDPMERLTQAANKNDMTEFENHWDELEVLWKVIEVALSESQTPTVVSVWTKVKGKVVWASSWGGNPGAAGSQESSVRPKVLAFGTARVGSQSQPLTPSALTEVQEVDGGSLERLISHTLDGFTNTMTGSMSSRQAIVAVEDQLAPETTIDSPSHANPRGLVLTERLGSVSVKVSDLPIQGPQGRDHWLLQYSQRR